jgi:hypothetical protein
MFQKALALSKYAGSLYFKIYLKFVKAIAVIMDPGLYSVNLFGRFKVTADR